MQRDALKSDRVAPLDDSTLLRLFIICALECETQDSRRRRRSL